MDHGLQWFQSYTSDVTAHLAPASAPKWIWLAADVTCKDLARGTGFILARARLAWPSDYC